jgi:hypothetical protein
MNRRRCLLTSLAGALAAPLANPASHEAFLEGLRAWVHRGP